MNNFMPIDLTVYMKLTIPLKIQITEMNSRRNRKSE